jgi:hypothetical protein
MRFSASVIATIVIMANSSVNSSRQAIWQRRRELTVDNPVNHNRREAFRTFSRNSKPIWEDWNDNPWMDPYPAMSENEEDEYDLDVGILECGIDQVCVPNPRSERGGFCQSIVPLEQYYRYLLPPGVSADAGAKYIYEAFCQGPLELVSYCDCTKFDGATFEGAISCTFPECFYSFNTTPAPCGSVSFSFDCLASGSIIQTYCLEISLERFCYSFEFQDYGYKCLSASMNGCTCSCESTQAGGYANDTDFGFLISCPNDLTSDLLYNGSYMFFGNKIESCEITNVPQDSPGTTNSTQSPSNTNLTQLPSTLPPSKPTRDDDPAATVTPEPSMSPVITNSASSSTLVKAISISVGGLMVIAAMIIAAFFFYRKHPHATPSDTYSMDAIEAVPVTFSNNNDAYIPTPMTPVSSMDRTIEAAAILDPGGSDCLAEAGVKVRKNVVPEYKDQVQSVACQGPAGIAEDVDVFPPKPLPILDPLTSDLEQPQGLINRTPPKRQQRHHLPDPPSC